jgi:ribosomal protein L37AE/L43A
MTNEPKPLEAEVLPTQAVAVREQHQSLAAAQPLTMQQVRAGLNAIHEVMRDCMTDGQDYGKVPGCGDKPGLFQPGAQKLSMMFQLNPAVQSETVTDYPNFHRGYRLVIRVTNGSKFAEGVGECSTMESKYRYRNANKVCPHCGKDTVFRSKNDPEWYCWQKKGGCGNVFKDGSPMAAKISEQTSGKVEHDNPADFWNTVRKMAFKRCLGSTTSVFVKTSNGILRTNLSGAYKLFHVGNGLEIATEKGWSKITGMIRESGKICRVITLNDGSVIYATNEHRFPIASGVLKNTENLKVGDSLKRSSMQSLFHAAGANYEVGWIVGLFLAEGNLAKSAARFTLSADEVDYAKRVCAFAETLGCSSRFYIQEGTNALRLSVGGEAFRGLIEQFVNGQTCYNKHLSMWAWRQNGQFLRGVLTGYLNGDGRLIKAEGRPQAKWVLRFTGRNETLALDIRALCGVFGFRHKIERKTATCNGKKFPAFFGWVAFDSPSYNGCDLEKIVSIKEKNAMVVYDLEVDSPDHLFCLANGIISHNSFVHAIINATNTSELWSQDLEDLAANGVVTGADRAATADRANQHANETAESPPASRPAAAPQSAARPAPARPAATGSPGDGLWKSVTVPKFIKKYAGSTLGEMAEKDLAWWCENYEPKPWKGKISQADLDFKAALDAAYADLLDNGESNNDGGNVGPADDDSVPF